MTNKRLYWIWLQNALGISSNIKSSAVMDYFGSAANVFDAGAYELRNSGLFSSAQLKELSNHDLDRAKKIFDTCTKNGWKVISPEDSDYPEMLRSIDSFPMVIYCWGDLSCVNKMMCMGIVGTRKPANKSIDITLLFASSLAKAGMCIVSGGAIGIDSCAHNGALYAKGKSVAVLGCGLGTRYLMGNAEMREQIARGGAVITEYPPFTPALPSHFPTRNRLISGISQALLVIEAGAKSGSLITANFALDQGRDIFVVPGDIVDSAFDGTNNLIRDGAKPVFSSSDILDEYCERLPNMTNNKKEDLTAALDKTNIVTYKAAGGDVRVTRVSLREQETVNESVEQQAPEVKKVSADLSILSDTAKIVYNFFADEPIHADEIIRMIDGSTAKALAAITELELLGFIKAGSGKFYEKLG